MSKYEEARKLAEQIIIHADREEGKRSMADSKTAETFLRHIVDNFEVIDTFENRYAILVHHNELYRPNTELEENFAKVLNHASVTESVWSCFLLRKLLFLDQISFRIDEIPAWGDFFEKFGQHMANLDPKPDQTKSLDDYLNSWNSD